MLATQACPISLQWDIEDQEQSNRYYLLHWKQWITEFIADIEKHVMTWIKDPLQQHIPLSTLGIMTETKSFLVMLKETSGPKYNVELTVNFAGF